MKRAFALLITLFMVALFSMLILQITFTQSISSNHQTQEYLHTQAQLHLKFFKTLILEAQEIDCTKRLVMQNNTFNIEAHVRCIGTHARIDAFVQSKTNTFHIRLHERFIKKL